MTLEELKKIPFTYKYGGHGEHSASRVYASPDGSILAITRTERRGGKWLKGVTTYSLGGKTEYETVQQLLEAINRGGEMTEQAALQKYKELADVDMSPIEALRFFLSFALKGQDWLDVEPFIENIKAHNEKREGK